MRGHRMYLTAALVPIAAALTACGSLDDSSICTMQLGGTVNGQFLVTSVLPEGKGLAQFSGSITYFDVSTSKTVTTFLQVTASGNASSAVAVSVFSVTDGKPIFGVLITRSDDGCWTTPSPSATSR